MKILNLGCGAHRPQSKEFTNLDNLRPILAVGTPERTNLDSESNYVNHDITSVLPFPNESFDSILCQHVIEHFDCQQGVAIMCECHRILKPGGTLLVSVPDAAVFRRNWDEDTAENAVRLFGEPIHLPDGETTFMGYAGFNRFHKVLLSEDALWCYFVRAGFSGEKLQKIYGKNWTTMDFTDPLIVMAQLLNRIPFSLMMAGTK